MVAPELVQQVIARAREDVGFRRALDVDPRGTVEREFGVTLPADLDIEGIRERVYSRFGTTETNSELNDEELETVAGGGEKHCSPDEEYKP